MRSRLYIHSPPLTAPLIPHTNRYRRSPIQVSALWRPVRQKVCSSISRRTTHLQSIFILGSDLLSRHINKCHPNEKPLVSSSTPSRRKGTSSASRATTSKQACDQCVQSTLPCDGANPCCQSRNFSPAYSLSRMPFYPAKCLHRKTRCTYVKFHRQTAPVGPGHPARSANDSSNPAHASLGALPLSLGSYRLPDPFLLPNSAPALNPAPVRYLRSGHHLSQPSTKNRKLPMIRVMLPAMPNPTICTTTPRTILCRRLRPELTTGIILTIRCASFISPPRSSIDLQSPSLSRSRATS